MVTLRGFSFFLHAVLATAWLAACGTTRYYAGLGVVSPGIKQTANQPSGAIGTFAPFSYPASLRMQNHRRGLHWTTALDSTFYPRTSPEGEVKHNYTLLRTTVGIKVADVKLSAGPLLWGHSIWGNGTGVVLNNGTSSRTFMTPGYRRTAWIWGIDTSVSIEMNRFLLSAEAILQGFASGDKRNVALLAGLAYRLGRGGESKK